MPALLPYCLVVALLALALSACKEEPTETTLDTGGSHAEIADGSLPEQVDQDLRHEASPDVVPVETSPEDVGPETPAGDDGILETAVDFESLAPDSGPELEVLAETAELAPDTSACKAACGELSAVCEAGTQFYDLFPALDDCVDVCMGYIEEQMFALNACLMTTGCDKALLCEDVPAEPLPGCDSFCEGLSAVCDEEVTQGALCDWACTGTAMGIPDSDPSGAADCLAGIESCPEEPYWLLSGCVAGKCTPICGLAQDCNPDSQYFDLFPSEAACQAACQAMNDSQAAATGICLATVGCEGALACEDPPVAPPEGCDDYCASLTALCPDIPWFLTTSCEDLCSGLTMVTPAADPAGAPLCIAQFETCPEDLDEVLWGCLTGKCGLMCGFFDQCMPYTSYAKLYKSADGCNEACAMLSYDQAQAVGVCHMYAGCDGALACTQAPELPPVGCDDYCAALLDLCPDVFDDFGKIPCVDICSGMTMAFDGADPAGAKDCLEAYEFCPISEEEASFGCLVTPSELCQTICQKMDSCDLLQEWECAAFCSSLEQQAPAQLNMIKACLELAGSDCAKVSECTGT